MIMHRFNKGIVRILKKRSQIQVFFCSGAKNEQKVHDFSSQHNIDKDKLAKDEQYQEMAYKFQREWQEIQNSREKEQRELLENELTEGQKKKLQFLADAITSCNVYELRYMSTIVTEKIMKTTSIDLMKLNIDWPSLKQLDNGSWPPNNPNWFLQQEAIAKLWPAGQQGMATIFNSLGFSGSGQGGAQQGGGQQQNQVQSEKPVVKEEKKEEKEKVEEKQNFDIELVAIDAAQKIKIIKEVRGIMNLGLKEAKDLVEKTPQIIRKGMKKSEAEELKEKLSAIGCQINLL